MFCDSVKQISWKNRYLVYNTQPYLLSASYTEIVTTHK